MRLPQPPSKAVLLLLCLFLGLASANAQTNWILDGDGAWGAAANWNPADVPNSVGGSVLLGSTITSNVTIWLSNNMTMGSLTISNAHNYTLSGAYAPVFEQSVIGNATASLLITNTGSPTITANIVLNNNLMVTQNSTGVLTLGGQISGTSHGLNIYGSGVVQLNDANTFGGGLTNAGTVLIFQEQSLGGGSNITLNGGTLQIGANITTLGAGSTTSNYVYTIGANGGTINVQSGYTFTIQHEPDGGSILSGSGTLTNAGAGILNLATANSSTFTGNIVIVNGTVQISAETNLGAVTGGLTLNGGTLEVTSSYTSSASKVYTVGANGGTILVDANQTLTLGSTGNLTGTGNLTEAGAGTLVLSGNNTGYTGTNIITGTVEISAENNLGTVTDSLIVSNGGTLEINGTFTNNASKVLYVGAGGANLDILSGFTNTLAGSSQINGSNTLTLTGPGRLSITGNQNTNWGGSVVINNGTLSFSSTTGNTNGSATGVTNFTVAEGGTLLLNNSTGINSNRLSSTASITMTGGNLLFVGTNASGTVTEHLGALTLAGGDSLVNVNNNIAGNTAALVFSSLTNVNGFSTISFENTNTGTLGTAGANPNIGFVTAPTLTNSIIGGWATARGTNGGLLEFATLTGTNVSALSTFAIGTNTTWAPTSNVELTNNQTLTSNTALYTLTMTNTRSLNLGGHTLTNVGSGLLAQAGDTVISNGTITVASNGAGSGGTLFVHVDTGGFLTNNAVLTNNGSGVVNLVKANNGTLLLGAVNTYTGVTYVNGGTLELNIANAVASNSDMTVASGATFNMNGFSQKLGSIAGAGTITSTAGTLTVGGDNASTTYSGVLSGGLGLTEIGTGTLTLSGANSFTGNMTISNGTISVSQDTNLGGASSQIVLAGGTLGVSQSFTANTNRTVDVTASGGSINVASGATLTFAATNDLTGSGTLTSSGAGTLILAGASNFTGNLAINNGGTVEAQGSTTAVNNLFTSNLVSGVTGNGGTLMWDYTGDNFTNTLSNQPSSGSNIKLGFNAGVGTSNANYIINVTNGNLNWAGIVVNGGNVFLGSNATVLGNGTTPTTLQINGGTMNLAGFNPTLGKTLTISGNAILDGGFLNGGPGGGSTATLVTSGSIISDGTILQNGPNITMTPANGITNTVSGTTPLDGVGNFTIGSGASNGTVQLNQRVYVQGTLQINSGTLLLGANNMLNDNANVTMEGITVNGVSSTLNSGGYQQTLGTLELAGSTNVLNLGLGNAAANQLNGTNSYLAFANSSAQSWSGSLVISNYYNSWDKIYFGTGSNGLTSAQLADVVWINPYGNGSNYDGAIIEANGLIQPAIAAPVPEAKTVAAVFFLVAFALWRERKWLPGLLAQLLRARALATVRLRGSSRRR